MSTLISPSLSPTSIASPWADRCKAALTHFLLTALVAAIVTVPLVFWLYPSPFFEAAGGMNLLGIIVVVDIVIGPFLTFCVFNRAKKSLRTDLAVIAMIQIAALIYGLYATIQSRPVFMTYVVDRYEMISFADVDSDELTKAPPEIQQLRWGHPQLAFAQQPDSAEERSLVMFSSMHGVDLNRLFRYYKPHALAKPLIAEKAKPLSELQAFNPIAKIDQKLAGIQRTNLGFVPVQGKNRDLTALVDNKTGELVQVVDLRPWKDK